MRLASIQRHPIKSHGRETLTATVLSEGAGLAGDRRWAVIHTRSKFDRAQPCWVPSANFVIGTKLPGILAIDARLDDASAEVTLTHPARPDLAIAPDAAEDQARFLAWVAPLVDPDQPPPVALVSLPGRGVTDTTYPSVSLLNLASNADLSARMGTDLSPLRWRCNLWLDGLEPWAEQGWIGRRLRIGAAVLEIAEPIRRCKSTMANPATGLRDADTLGALRAAWDHQNFGLYARVLTGGAIRRDDPVELL